MAKLPPINDRQRQVLERIAEGTRPVTRLDTQLVASVNALSNRHLVTKTKTPGGGWIALLTDAGRDCLAGKSPSPPALSPEHSAVVHEPTRVFPAADLYRAAPRPG